LSALFTLILYGQILGQVLDFFLHRPSKMVGVSTPGWALQEAIRVLQQGFGGVALGLFLGGAVFCLGLWRYWRSNPLALALFVLPAIVMVAGALTARGTMYPRFFFSLAGFAVLIAVRGARLPLVVGVMIALSAVSLYFNYRYPKQDFAGALAYVESTAAPEDEIVTAGIAHWPYERYFDRKWGRLDKAEQVPDLRSGGRTVWVVYTFPRYIQAATPDVAKVIDEECKDRQRFPGTLGGGDLFVCKL
jgi:hypothetical protein